MSNCKTRKYDFPNATLLVNKERCLEIPRWCPMISVERTRSYAAEALWELRRYERGEADLSNIESGVSV